MAISVRCRDCGCNFTDTPRRGKPAALKVLAVLLYAMGNASYGMIARLFGVSEVAVFKWIRKEAAALPDRATNEFPDIRLRNRFARFDGNVRRAAEARR